VPWSHSPDAVAVVRARRAAGDRIVVLEQAHGAVPLERARLEAPLCLVLGHERRGVPAELLELADELVELPAWGMANSLNVAMSAAIVGYEAARRSGGFGLQPL
jgi:tRNA (guanosine-2'-O-)-methyltransferase